MAIGRRALAVALLGLSCRWGVAEAESFDFFMLTTFWPPEVCQQKNSDCGGPLPWWKGHFTAHGLWPQNQDGSYPKGCEAEAFDMKKIDDAIGIDTLKTYWPNPNGNVDTDSVKNYEKFWSHEWEAHGQCSGLGLTGYFQAAVDLIKQHSTPAVVSRNVGKSVTYDELVQGFGGDPKVVLECEGKNLLLSVITCWSRGAGGKPGAQIKCPASLDHHDSCDTGNDIDILSF